MKTKKTLDKLKGTHSINYEPTISKVLMHIYIVKKKTMGPLYIKGGKSSILKEVRNTIVLIYSFLVESVESCLHIKIQDIELLTHALTI